MSDAATFFSIGLFLGLGAGMIIGAAVWAWGHRVGHVACILRPGPSRSMAHRPSLLDRLKSKR